MPAGRPLAFESVAELEEKIGEYFDSDDAHFVSVEDIRLFSPTVSGLAYHLGVSTETVRAYGEKDEFSATIKRAKQRIEISLEKRLAGQAVTGTIFNLKNNFGWKDKTEQEITGRDGGPIETKTLTVVGIGTPAKDS